MADDRQGLTVADLLEAIADGKVRTGMRIGLDNGVTGHVQGVQRISLEEHDGEAFLVLQQTEETVACHDDGMPDTRRVLV